MTKSIYLHVTSEDIPYLPHMKKLLGGAASSITISSIQPATYYEIVIRAKDKGCTQVATSSPFLLKHLLGWKGGKLPSLDDYQGSIIEKAGTEFLILPPLKQLVTVNYAKFLFERYLSKFLKPDAWLKLPEFRWTLYEPQLEEAILSRFQTATLISCDIETVVGDADRSIDCVGFSAVYLSNNSFSIYTIVVPLDSADNLRIVRAILSLRIPKIFQNGKYDNIYLMRYRCFSNSYCFDTINLFHSWYSELPKDLGFIASFSLRKWQYWKDTSGFDRMQHFEYNARDCFATAMSALALLREMPEWARQNYKMEFPLVFPCLQAELTGIARDKVFMDAELQRFSASIEVQLTALQTMTGEPRFNPNSWQQVAALMTACGSKDIADVGTGKVPLDKFMFRHPLNYRLGAAIKKIREDRKLVSSYLRDEEEKPSGEITTKSWFDRIFFSINPHATDTGRLASKESAFWCGWQIQNFPRDRKDIQIKRGLVSDPGFFLGECDRSQAETRDTAYITGDTNLLAAINDVSKDFHGRNAASFFGIPYHDIVRSESSNEEGKWIHTTLDADIRDLSKRTNHGANYNMAAQMLLDTMGIKNVIRARELLGLPRSMSLLQVCQYLLDRFDETYPIVRSKKPGGYYHYLIATVADSRKLTGQTGWTRYCFGDPANRKPDLNALAAHGSQSLNAMELNVSYLRVFREVAIPNPRDFKLLPQIHDSILFAYRKGRIDLARQVAVCMDNPIIITDIAGVKRTMRIPTDLKGEAERWSELKKIR